MALLNKITRRKRPPEQEPVITRLGGSEIENYGGKIPPTPPIPLCHTCHRLPIPIPLYYNDGLWHWMCHNCGRHTPPINGE
jgi:hypothetical protein